MAKRHSFNEIAFSKMTINGICGVFTELRVQRDTIPQQLHMYEIRHDDSGLMCTIEKKVFADFAGTFITEYEFEFGDVDYINIDEWLLSAANLTEREQTVYGNL